MFQCSFGGRTIYSCCIMLNACVVTEVNKNTSSIFQVSRLIKSHDRLKASENLLHSVIFSNKSKHSIFKNLADRSLRLRSTCSDHFKFKLYLTIITRAIECFKRVKVMQIAVDDIVG